MRPRPATMAITLTLVASALGATLGASQAQASASAFNRSTPAAVAAATTLPFSFHATAFAAYPVAPAKLPFAQSGVIPKKITKPHDSTGVVMRKVGTRLYNHAYLQAAFGMANLDSYRLSKNKFYLNRAVAQAKRIIATRVASGGAWFYPYRFNFSLHGKTSDVMKAPWYSAMAQGVSLALFSRLYSTTKNKLWATAAAQTFNSFLVKPSATKPWVVHSDTGRYLWLEEYPRWPITRSDYTYNGHMFAITGLYDYYRLTKSPLVLKFYRGALTTVLHYFPSYRVRGWQSFYCLKHHQAAGHYHSIHASQYGWFWSMTHYRAFANGADRFNDDYSSMATKGSVFFSKGAHRAYKFSKTGAITASRNINFTRNSLARASLRVQVYKRGIYYVMGNGTLSGWSIPERSGTSYLRGIYRGYSYTPARTARFPKGTIVAYGYNRSGIAASSKPLKLISSSLASVSARAVVNGQWYVRVSNGSLAGLWVLKSKVTFI